MDANWDRRPRFRPQNGRTLSVMFWNFPPAKNTSWADSAMKLYYSIESSCRQLWSHRGCRRQCNQSAHNLHSPQKVRPSLAAFLCFPASRRSKGKEQSRFQMATIFYSHFLNKTNGRRTRRCRRQHRITEQPFPDSFPSAHLHLLQNARNVFGFVDWSYRRGYS
jgi:hypothetical protein